jgi:hypothetical protein
MLNDLGHMPTFEALRSALGPVLVRIDLTAQTPAGARRPRSAGRHSKPYTVPPDDSLVTGAVLDIAAQLLGIPDRHEARERLAPLVLRLRDAERALSTYLRRPGWISKQLRSAVEDEWKGASRRSKPSTSSPASSPAEPRTTRPTSTWSWPLAARAGCPRLHPPHTLRTRRRRLKHHRASAAHRDSGAPSPRLAGSTTRPLGSTGSFGFAPQAASARRHEIKGSRPESGQSVCVVGRGRTVG